MTTKKQSTTLTGNENKGNLNVGDSVNLINTVDGSIVASGKLLSISKREDGSTIGGRISDGESNIVFNTTIESIVAIRTDDATPDWTSATPFIVGQTMVTPSSFSMFIGHAKNGTPCFYFANVDADGDPVNIQDAICDLANHLNIDQKLFNEMLSRVSMSLATVDAVESSIHRHYKTESLKIIHAMQNGERGHKFGNLYFTMLNLTK
jgi:hypothetical protein